RVLASPAGDRVQNTERSLQQSDAQLFHPRHCEPFSAQGDVEGKYCRRSQNGTSGPKGDGRLFQAETFVLDFGEWSETEFVPWRILRHVEWCVGRPVLAAQLNFAVVGGRDLVLQPDAVRARARSIGRPHLRVRAGCAAV